MKQTFLKIAMAVALSGGNLLVQAQDTEIGKNTGDLYDGLTRKITYNQMIPPYGIEVSFYKTVHVVFPAQIRYVDLGSIDLIAGKADGAGNVLRVKSSVDGFNRETNFSVITEDGSFYSFNAKYANEPEKLNIEMKDFLHEHSEGNTPNNQLDIYLKELGNESPALVKLIMKAVYREDKRVVKHIGDKRFGIQFLLKSIYVYNEMLYFHTQIKNSSNVNYNLDFIRFKIVDKKVPKRTAIQETTVYPMRAYNNLAAIEGNATVRSMYAIKKFTIPDDKVLVIELAEKNGGRHLSFTVENADIVGARQINELKVQ